MRAWICLIPLLAGCSLMGITDIDLARCRTDEDCLPLSERKGLHPECLRYACTDEGSCVIRPENEEVWDGFDNDCDGVIDEPTVDAEGNVVQTITPEVATIVEGVPSTARIAYAANPSGGVLVSWTVDRGGADEGWFTRFDLENPSAEQMGYLHDDTNDLENLNLRQGCYRRRGEKQIGGPMLCDFSEVALGVTKNAVLHEHQALFVASVSTFGCAEGQLRIGFFELGEDPNVILLGPGKRSNSYLGVDLPEDVDGDDEGTCSEVAPEGTKSKGVARPAMVVSEQGGRPPQALVSWIADANGRDECGGRSAPVQVIGAFLESHAAHFGGFGWVTTTNEGRSQNLGWTAGGGRPAVASVGELGYFVGYGDEGGNLNLHFIPVLVDPPEYDGFTCNDCDVHDRTGLMTDAIEGIVDFEPIEPSFDGPVDHVEISVGTIDETSIELGVAWLEGCGADGASVVFRRLIFVSQEGRPTEDVELGPAERLAGPAQFDRRLGVPTLAYLDEGFVLEGFVQDGSMASGQDLGGWYVSWSEGPSGGAQVFVRRVLELDGRTLEHEGPIGISQSDFTNLVDVGDSFLALDNSDITMVFRERTSEMLLRGRLSP